MSDREIVESSVIKTRPRSFPSLHEPLVRSLQDLRRRFDSRGISCELFGHRDPGADCYGIEIGIADSESLRTELTQGDSKLELRITHLSTQSTIGKPFALEDRVAYQQSREQRAQQYRAKYEQECLDYEKSLAEFQETTASEYEQQVVELRAKWDAGANARNAAAAGRRAVLVAVGVAEIVAGLVLTYFIYDGWDLSEYYDGVLKTNMGFLIIKLAFLVFPPAVLIVLPLLAGMIGVMIIGAGEARTPTFRPPPAPTPPPAPKFESEVDEGPYAVLDSTELLRSYCMASISSALDKAWKAWRKKPRRRKVTR